MSEDVLQRASAILAEVLQAAALNRAKLKRALGDRPVITPENAAELATSIEGWAETLSGWEEEAKNLWGINVLPFKPRVISNGFEPSPDGA